MTERVLQVLGLFSIERPAWTADQVAAELGVAVSSAYRLIRALSDVGLVDAAEPGRYVLGPAAIQLDRQIQLTDPMLLAARPVMTELADFGPDGTVVLLCRAFSDSVLCVHQIVRGPQPPVSYERGKPRPLLRGATSKCILAFTPTRALKRFYQTYAAEIANAGLGQDLDDFLGQMRKLRKPGFITARAEVDAGRFGISAPVLRGERGAIGSLSYVLDEKRADERTVNRLAPVIVAGAREIERAMQAAPAAWETRPTPRRKSVG